MEGGERGDWYRAGRRTEEILVGQRQSASSSWFESCYEAAGWREGTSRSTEITEESLRVGGMGAVETDTSTRFLGEYMRSLKEENVPYTHGTLLARTTQQMIPPEAFFHHQASSSHQSLSPTKSESSSLTLMRHLLQKSSDVSDKGNLQVPEEKPLTMTIDRVWPLAISNSLDEQKKSFVSETSGRSKTRFDQALPPRSNLTAKPRPYTAGLKPIESGLRPHCVARERLQKWRPVDSERDIDSPISLADVQRIQQVMVFGWADNTMETYGSGLLVYHVFCDKKNIPEVQRAPANSELIEAFVAALAGSYSEKTVNNYLAAIRAWHLLHGATWRVNKIALQPLLKGVASLAPDSSSKLPREPYTTEILIRIREQLNLNIPLDAATWGCATSLFWGVGRMGELTVEHLTAFNPTEHPTIANIRVDTDRNNLSVTCIFVPRTKASSTGEDIYWSSQVGLADPQEAFNNHVKVNRPSENEHLFSYQHSDGRTRRPLTRKIFIKCITVAAEEAQVAVLKGHAFRIGGTLEYLLRGLPLEAVKVKGRWASEAFAKYLRRHAQIMAPYMQAQPHLHEAVVRAAIAPVR